MTTGLEGAFSAMRLHQGAKPQQPLPGQTMTVRNMTPAQERELTNRVNDLIETKKQLEAANKAIADAKAGQAQARKQQQEGQQMRLEGQRMRLEGQQMRLEAQAQAAQARTAMAVANDKTKQNLENMSAVMLKMQEANKGNPEGVKRIEALRQKILAYKDNLPPDTASRQKQMQQFQQEAAVIVQSLKQTK